MQDFTIPASKTRTYPLPLGLSDAARDKLAELSGGTPEVFYIISDARERTTWRSTSDLPRLARRRPMYVASTWSAPDPDKAGADDRARLHLANGIWLDIDAHADRGETVTDAVKALSTTTGKLQALGIDPECCSLFASGGKGFHIFVPLALIVPGGVADVGLLTVRHWPRICRAFVMNNFLTDLTDHSIYNGGRGRIFRQAGVQRSNGAYKVPLNWNEWQGLASVESYKTLCSAPRPASEPAPVQGVAPGAAVAWIKALREVIKPAPRKVLKTRTAGSEGRLLGTERRRIVNALGRLSDLPYADWIRVGAALKSTGASDALAIWESWSSKYPRHKPGECEKRWKGLSGDCTLGTLYFLAAQSKPSRRGARS